MTGQAYADRRESILASIERASNHYDSLGVSRAASGKEIKDSYRNIMRSIHPDSLGSAVSDEFKLRCNQASSKVSIAYATLKDPDKRSEYDAQLNGGNSARPRDHSKNGQSTASPHADGREGRNQSDSHSRRSASASPKEDRFDLGRAINRGDSEAIRNARLDHQKRYQIDRHLDLYFRESIKHSVNTGSLSVAVKAINLLVAVDVNLISSRTELEQNLGKAIYKALDNGMLDEVKLIPDLQASGRKAALNFNNVVNNIDQLGGFSVFGPELDTPSTILTTLQELKRTSPTTVEMLLSNDQMRKMVERLTKSIQSSVGGSANVGDLNRNWRALEAGQGVLGYSREAWVRNVCQELSSRGGLSVSGGFNPLSATWNTWFGNRSPLSPADKQVLLATLIDGADTRTLLQNHAQLTPICRQLDLTGERLEPAAERWLRSSSKITAQEYQALSNLFGDTAVSAAACHIISQAISRDTYPELISQLGIKLSPREYNQLTRVPGFESKLHTMLEKLSSSPNLEFFLALTNLVPDLPSLPTRTREKIRQNLYRLSITHPEKKEVESACRLFDVKQAGFARRLLAGILQR